MVVRSLGFRSQQLAGSPQSCVGSRDGFDFGAAPDELPDEELKLPPPPPFEDEKDPLPLIDLDPLSTYGCDGSELFGSKVVVKSDSGSGGISRVTVGRSRRSRGCPAASGKFD